MCFHHLGIELDWRGEPGTLSEQALNRKTGKAIIKVDPKYFRPAEVELLIGDPTLAREKLGWVAKTSVSELAKMMVEADYKKSDV